MIKNYLIEKKKYSQLRRKIKKAKDEEKKAELE